MIKRLKITLFGWSLYAAGVVIGYLIGTNHLVVWWHALALASAVGASLIVGSNWLAK